jgi:hypothetical protein
MNCKGEFSGRIVINGKVEAESVSVFITEDSIAIRNGGEHLFAQKEFSASPFNKFMLFTQDPQKISDGYFYEIRGTRVGGFRYGPLGHPGDGEFDYRPIRFIRLDVKYLRDRISTTISGTTDSGSSPFDREASLEPWRFTIQFEIPKSELQSFFHLTDSVRDYALGLFEKHGNPTTGA